MPHSTPGAVAKIPLYDKSLRGGRGDRAPEDAWPTVTGPLQVVCLEGWCLGFRPVSDEAAAKVNPGLPASNAALRTYAAAIESRCDAWVVVRVAEPSWVFDWRSQAETEMRAAGKPGLSDEQVRDFVARFMPAYQAYLPVRLLRRVCLRIGGVLRHRVLTCVMSCVSRSFMRWGRRGGPTCRAWRWTLTARAR